MLSSSMMRSRRFFPGSLVFVLLWGAVSLFLWEVTRSFSMIQPVHGPFVALLLFLSAASAVYFLLSLGFYFQDREVMEVPGRWIVFALLCLVILAYLANHPGCRCGELGNLLGLEQKHCLTVLQKLMAQGLIERENNRYYVTDP